MKINKGIKEVFKNHKANFRDLREIQILDWKQDNTICGSIRYVFDGNRLYISGDYGHSVYWLTWKGTPQSFKDINLGYFYEKIEAHEGDKYSFDEKTAIEQIKYHMAWMFETYNDEKEEAEKEIKDLNKEISKLDKNDEYYDEELDDIKNEIESIKSNLQEVYEDEKISDKEQLLERVLGIVEEANCMESWTYYLCESRVTDELCDFDCEYSEWIYSVGKSIPERAELHLAGLKLAVEYMEKENV